MIKDLARKVEFFASTEDEAMDIVDDAREEENGEYIVGQNIQAKSNKNGEYFHVILNYKFNTPAGIMESELNDEETPQTTTEEEK
ncbi:hypothetical protein FM106_18655 [Brachybacterium faecium]|nr:hypothetical protein FM106_18655 [Brachybacterium faecium]